MDTIKLWTVSICILKKVLFMVLSVGMELWLVSSDTGKISVYDTSLNLLETKNVSALDKLSGVPDS